MASILRLGIAGLGAAAAQVLPALKDLSQIKLTAVADIRPEAGAPFVKQGVAVFDSVEALVASQEIDAVWVATPNPLHARHTILAAEHGKHVICEKPMAVTLEECQAMIEAVQRNGVKYVQGHSKIYEHPIRRMRELIAGGSLGRVVQINTWNYNDWLLRPRLASEVDTTQGGGLLFRQGPHQADIVRYLGGGMVKSVRAVAGRRDPNFNTEGDYTAWLEFEDGAVATVCMNGYGYFDVTELTWNIGEGGRVTIEGRQPRPRPSGPVTPREKYTQERSRVRSRGRSKRQPFFGLTVVSCERGVVRQSPNGLYVYHAQGRSEIACPPPPGRAAELLELYKAVKQNRPAFPDGPWARASLELCVAMLRSSQEGREIRLMHQVPSPA